MVGVVELGRTKTLRAEIAVGRAMRQREERRV